MVPLPKTARSARTVKNSFFNVFYAWYKSLSFPNFRTINIFYLHNWIMFHLEWKREPYILDSTIWDFGHSDIARSAKWRMKFQMEGTRHSPFNNDKWFANGKNESLLLLHTVRALLEPAVCIFFTHFYKTISLFSRRFFQKILSLCMVNIQERFLIKSGLWWRAYGSWKQLCKADNRH